ncbi:MAG TPA: TetR/AcrR family transcriptional regulator [Tepidisphaeraceae bacterium]|nr:TetR/AcrR family transcriptional regulator [Tepidisphaeraceae bacterium]
MPRLKAEQRREQLIQVALQVFARGGYDGSTTAEIAKAAEITEPILYRHFKSKQDLFIAIVREVSSKTIEQWSEAVKSETDPEERFRKLCAGLPEHIKRHADAYHVLHGALTNSRDKRVIDVIREHYNTLQGFIRDVIKAGQDAGVFRPEMKAKSAAWHIIMTGVGYATLSLNLGSIDRASIGETIDEFLRGMKQ